jgi:hypothetical protein
MSKRRYEIIERSQRCFEVLYTAKDRQDLPAISIWPTRKEAEAAIQRYEDADSRRLSKEYSWLGI